MSWLSALPAALVAVAWVLLPGLAITYALGVRGVAAWGIAPLLSIGSVAVTAVAAGQLGIRWSPVVAAGGALLFSVTALGVRAGVLRLRPPREPRRGDGRRPALAAAVGMAAAAVAGLVTAGAGIGGADAVSQTYDAVFHYNAVADILSSGNASSLFVGTLTNPSDAAAFYPAAWHDLVSLVVLSSTASVPLASNVVAVVVAAVVWPLSCLALVRQVVGRSAAAALITPLVAVGFVAFPWSLMSFGVLWPNLIGLALVPAGLAAVLTLCGLARTSAVGAGQAWAIVGASGAALGLAHPNTVFSLVVLATCPFLWWLAARLRALAGAGRWVIVTAAIVTVLGVGAAAFYLVVESPLFAEVRAFDWPAYESPPQAAGEVLLNATNGKDAAWAISLVVVVGAFAAGRDRPSRWLVPAHVVSGMLFLMAASLETTLAAALTGLWYNDSYRLAAMIPVTGVPLAVLGLLATGSWAARWVRPTESEAVASRLRRSLRPGVLATAATALLAVLSSGMYVREHAEFITAAYPGPAQSSLLTPQQREFFTRVSTLVPADAVVAQNPWTGSALLWALTGREVLFPHMDGNWTADQRYLAEHLDKAETDPQVCAIVNSLRVDYVLTGDVHFWPGDGRTKRYPGLEGARTAPGFELVAADSGGDRLYRITACGAPAGHAS